MQPLYNFCPTCAHPLADRKHFGRLRRACSRCGFIHFQEPKVAVSILVEDHRERVLLVKRAVRPRIGSWAFPGGFMDFDEDPRSAAQREVAEETGLSVRITGILDIAPLRGEEPRQGIIIFFQAKPYGGTLRPGDDASEARWFSAAEIPFAELAFPGTRQLLEGWSARVLDKPG